MGSEVGAGSTPRAGGAARSAPGPKSHRGEPRRIVFGRSVEGTRLVARRVSGSDAAGSMLVVGEVHGDEQAYPRRRRIWSLREGMTAYDAAYAAAAEAFDAPLLSVIRGMLRACDQAGIPATHLDELAAP